MAIKAGSYFKAKVGDGPRLRDARQAGGMTNKEACAYTALNVSELSRYELEQQRFFNSQTVSGVTSLAKHFGLTLTFTEVPHTEVNRHPKRRVPRTAQDKGTAATQARVVMSLHEDGVLDAETTLKALSKVLGEEP